MYLCIYVFMNLFMYFEQVSGSTFTEKRKSIRARGRKPVYGKVPETPPNTTSQTVTKTNKDIDPPKPTTKVTKAPKGKGKTKTVKAKAKITKVKNPPKAVIKTIVSNDEANSSAAETLVTLQNINKKLTMIEKVQEKKNTPVVVEVGQPRQPEPDVQSSRDVLGEQIKWAEHYHNLEVRKEQLEERKEKRRHDMDVAVKKLDGQTMMSMVSLALNKNADQEIRPNAEHGQPEECQQVIKNFIVPCLFVLTSIILYFFFLM
jgi:hypothetical protein